MQQSAQQWRQLVITKNAKSGLNRTLTKIGFDLSGKAARVTTTTATPACDLESPCDELSACNVIE
jgi:hypothetical protein